MRLGIGAGVATVVLILALALGAAGEARHEYNKFVHGTKESHVAKTRERLTDPANNGRLPLWQAALDIFETHPLRGTGAGTYPARPGLPMPAGQPLLRQHRLAQRCVGDILARLPRRVPAEEVEDDKAGPLRQRPGPTPPG